MENFSWLSEACQLRMPFFCRWENYFATHLKVPRLRLDSQLCKISLQKRNFQNFQKTLFQGATSSLHNTCNGVTVLFAVLSRAEPQYAARLVLPRGQPAGRGAVQDPGELRRRGNATDKTKRTDWAVSFKRKWRLPDVALLLLAVELSVLLLVKADKTTTINQKAFQARCTEWNLFSGKM